MKSANYVILYGLPIVINIIYNVHYNSLCLLCEHGVRRGRRGSESAAKVER